MKFARVVKYVIASAACSVATGLAAILAAAVLLLLPFAVYSGMTPGFPHGQIYMSLLVWIGVVCAGGVFLYMLADGPNRSWVFD